MDLRIPRVRGGPPGDGVAAAFAEARQFLQDLMQLPGEDIARAREEAIAAIRAAAGRERDAIPGLSGQAAADIATLRQRMIEATVESRQRLAQHDRVLAEHGRQLPVHDQALTSYRDLLARHGQLVARHAELLARHSQVLEVLQARLACEDPGLTHAGFLVHHQLAGRLQALFTQRLPGLSGIRAQHERGHGDDTDPPLREAELVREMCLALFGQQEPDLARLAAIATSGGALALAGRDSRLLRRVQQEAQELRAAVTGTGHQVGFTFELPDGTVADPGRHELWASSVAGDPVAFVVTPGYEASGQPIMPPGVITARISAGA